MTLLRQLVLVIVVLFLLLFTGTFVINLHNTRAYLTNQLHTISQDTATSLGLSLSPHMAHKDIIVVESLVAAIADSGYYREVVVSDIQGKPIVSRIQPIQIADIPQWFIKLIPIETPRAEALVMNGWQQAGSVRISANPGVAYATLWSNSIDAFSWFLGSSVIVFVLGVVALHFILRPLREVEAQAKAICDREYPVQTKLPWTLELRSVVEAMNRMTSKVREMFNEQAQAIERMRTEAYRDAVTGLANRRYFEMQLRALIESTEHFETGAVLFFEVNDFKRFNEQHGYQAGDQLLNAIGLLIQQLIKKTRDFDGFAARLAGGNFAVVLVNVDDTGVGEFAQRFSQALEQLQKTKTLKLNELGHIGVAIYHGQAMGELLAQADMALRTAQLQGPHAVYMHNAKNTNALSTLSSTQWGALLNDVLEKQQIALFHQAVIDSQDANLLLHHEILLHIYDSQGEIIPAGVCLPMVKRLGLAKQFDQLVIRMVIEHLAFHHPREALTRVAINLFPASIEDAGFVNWAGQILREHPQVAARMVFELSDYGAIQNLDALRAWIQQISQTGAKTSIDHFGRGFNSFDYLSTLKIDYLKIDGSYIRGIHENRDNQFLVDSLTKIAHSLDIQVIAESVETAAEWAMLKTLRVNGVQGYGVRAPLAWVRETT